MSATFSDLRAGQTNALGDSTADDFAEKVVPDLEYARGIVEVNNDTQILLSDGGLWAWATVFGSWICMFTGSGYSNAFGVFQDYYVREYLTSYSSSQISWIGSTKMFLMMSAGIFTGRLFDKGYFYHLVITGSILVVFSNFMLSLAQPDQYYQIFLAQALCFGLGSGIAYIPCFAVIAQHFHSPHKRALAMGIVASGSSLGGILHPVMLNHFFNGSLGFGGGVRVSASMMAGMQLVAICLMRSKYPENGQEEVKHLPYREAWKKFSKDYANICVLIAAFLFSQAIFFPVFYIQLDAVKHGVNSSFAFYSISMLNAASLVGEIVPGYFTRYIGVPMMMIISCGICAVLVFCMLAVKTAGAVGSFSVLYGFFSGAYYALLPPMVSVLTHDPAELGARMGFCYAVQGFGSLIGTPITGALLTANFIWWQPVLYSGLLCVGGCLAFCVCYIILRRRKLEQMASL